MHQSYRQRSATKTSLLHRFPDFRGGLLPLPTTARHMSDMRIGRRQI
jgi:hypothetical protein